MNRQELAQIIERFSPLETQAEWDHSGWQIAVGDPDIRTVLTALDVTEEVAAEAETIRADVIVVHHPMFFNGLYSVDENTGEGNLLIRLIRDGISVYASHTPFDRSDAGNNVVLGKALGFENIRIVEGGEDFVRAGSLPEPVPLRALAERLRNCAGLADGSVRFVGDPGKMIRTGCWCTGSGGEFLRLAQAEGADVFITGDFRYHDAVAASGEDIAVIDGGHFGTEILFRSAMAEELRARVPAVVRVEESRVEADPFSW